jgi:hypothetical protein
MNSHKIKMNNDELVEITSILLNLGFKIEGKQPHISGERACMQAVTTKSGKKFILIGHRIKDNQKVVIKLTKDLKGKQEIKQERLGRQSLKKIMFAYKIFFTPKEILFTEKKGYLILIQTFIEQKSTFLNRPIEEQFELALQTFKAQEGAHATTYEHKKDISKTFGSVNSSWYLKLYKTFKKNIIKHLPDNKHLQNLLKQGEKRLTDNKENIEQYCNFLTHTDFVPHNFRVIDRKIYLLDHSSLRFGNKYEGWARFLNFMTLYNRPLEEALIFYVKNNKTKEEYSSLNLMRIYRLGEILWYYTNLLEKTSGDLHILTKERIKFWTNVLEATLNNKLVSEKIVTEYKTKRDLLRSEEEKERQKDLH